LAGAIVLRENFRDRERTRVSIRENSRMIQPNDHFISLKPLQRGERGQLGASVPLAARAGAETTAKNAGSGSQGATQGNQAGSKNVKQQQIQQQRKQSRAQQQPKTQVQQSGDDGKLPQ